MQSQVIESVMQPSERRYTIGEEIANSVSHGVGCALGVAALVLLVVRAAHHGGGAHLAGALFMGIPLIVEYLFSTLYHAIQPAKAKAVLRVFDHACIYLLIAGSYAPFALITLAERGGQRLFMAVCGLALVGIIAEVFLRERQPTWLDSAIFLALGWVVIFRIRDVIELLPAPAFWLLLAGGLCYSMGALLYLAKKTPYLHFVFHLFALAGSVCITLSALLFVV
ncbi:MAG: hemolysin III family protein [Atopobiaceae bacterium]|nr:hemolysin III family protein [Atopobiaceae bacterium]